MRFLHRPGDAFCICYFGCYYALSVYFRVGRRLTDVRAVAVVVAAMLTQRWRRSPAHGASRLPQPLAEALVLMRRGCARSVADRRV